MAITIQKVIFLLFLSYAINAEEDKEIDRISSLKLEKSQPYQSWMSKIASWIFPFGGGQSDSTPAADYIAAPKYLPPHHQQPIQPEHQKDCNPCNLEPWIPVVGKVPVSGQPTVVNFIPPQQQSSHQPVFRPKPSRANYGLPKVQKFNLPQFMVPPPPPPTTHLRPVQNYAPIGMLPPPFNGGHYHSLPISPPLNNNNNNQYLPPPVPSDSYGIPVTGANANFPVRQEYLLPVPIPEINHELALETNISPPSDNYGTPISGPAQQQFLPPIPLPNLSTGLVLPVHNSQNFNQHSDQTPHEGGNNVQIVPSIKIADYVSSIEHPINVIQSPLVELSVKEESGVNLNENPIIVEDTHTAATAINASVNNEQVKRANDQDLGIVSLNVNESKVDNLNGINTINSNLLKELLMVTSKQNRSFTPPPMDYGEWTPFNRDSVTTLIPPPPVQPSTWLYSSTTRKPSKQIQIIVPYVRQPISNIQDMNQARIVPPSIKMKPVSLTKPFTTIPPLYMSPPNEEQVWSKFIEDYNLAESKKIPATAFTPPPPSTTIVSNIRDLLKDIPGSYPQSNLPYDVISLQNHIHDWTQTAFHKGSTTKLVPSKKIPDDFFRTSTLPYETTTLFNVTDHELAGSDIETNLILEESTTTTTTESSTIKNIPTPPYQKDQKSLWDITQVTVSPITKEKVYIVTPQPVKKYSAPPKILTNDKTKFLIKVEAHNKSSARTFDKNENLRVVFSEWPHLINNLQTTTSTSPKSTSRHPLFGLMDFSSYTPSSNSTIHTISGHSKVVTVVTPKSVSSSITNNNNFKTVITPTPITTPKN